MGLFNFMKGDPSGLSGSDKLMVLGAMLKDFGAGGRTNNVGELSQLLQGRREKAAKEAKLAEMQKTIGGLFGGKAVPAAAAIPEAQSVGDYRPGLVSPAVAATPQLPQAQAKGPASTQDMLQAMMPYMFDPDTAGMSSNMIGALKMMQPEKPQIVEGPDGIYEIGPDGAKKIQAYPEKPQGAPAGYRWKADGSGIELIPGYAEGIAQTSGVRRDAVVSRPMPRVGGGGGGRGGGGSPRKIAGRVLGASLPPGY